MSESGKGNSAKYLWRLGLVRQAGNIISLTRSDISVGEESRVGDDTLYMQRLLLEWGVRRRSLRLHIIWAKDMDKCLHDHPWPFKAFVIWGGYVEEIPMYPHNLREAAQGFPTRKEVTVKPFRIHSRPLDYKHRIVRLLRRCSITLAYAGPTTQHWGFHTNHGKENWEDFVAVPNSLRIPWCKHQ